MAKECEPSCWAGCSCSHDNTSMAPLKELFEPWPRLFGVRLYHRRAGAMHQQGAPIAIAPFADPELPDFAAGTQLSRGASVTLRTDELARRQRSD